MSIEPDWIEALRNVCKKSSQQKAGLKIGYSTAVVCAVLKGSYKGDLEKVEHAVRAKIMNASVHCTYWQESIPVAQCDEYQRAQPPYHNPNKLALSKVCPTCQHYKGEK